MRVEQRAVVKWMNAQLRRMGIAPEQWAKRAHIHPSTVTRARDEAYGSVTSVPTLHALAVAAGAPSVLDFLNEETGRAVAPDSAQVTTIVRAVLERDSSAAPERLAASIAYGLALLMRTPEDLRNEGAVYVAAHAAAEHLSA